MLSLRKSITVYSTFNTIKKYFLLVAGIFLTAAASAQGYFNHDRVGYNSYYQPRIGFEADGVFSSTIHADNGANYFNTGKVTGVRLGFTFDLPVNYPLTFSTGLLYSQKGYTANTPSGDYTQHFQFAEVPLLAKIRAGKLFNIYIGPEVDIVLKASDTYNSNFVGADEQYYNYYGTSTILCGVAGLGFNITPEINIHARYALDIQGVHSNGNTDIPFYRNQAIQVGVGFKLFDPLFK